MSRQKNLSHCDISDMNLLQRRQYLRGLCPCRTNSSDDIDGWRELFNRARFGSYSERKSAAHSIGTLLDKAKKSEAYRNLLKEFQADLDELMLDPRSASQVLGVLKKHGHAHKGAARKNYRRAYSIFSFCSTEEIADWVNETFDLTSNNMISKDSPIVHQLVKWIQHRAKFEPTRKVTDAAVIKQAQRLMPSLGPALA